MAEADDTQISTREFDARIEEVRRAVDLARETAGSQVELREYIERIFVEGQRATEMAEREREKAASALTTERYNAAETAEREREKSAQALRSGLDKAISAGDERLREHIFNQVAQIQEAMSSANGLEAERFERAKAEVEALRREMRLIQNAAAEAVNKAENSQKEINYRGNQFRGQLADQAANLMPRKEVEALVNDMRKRVDDLLPRETFDTAVSSLERRITANTSSLDRTRGVGEGEDGARGRSEFATSTLIAVVVAAVSVIAVIVAIANTLS
ncbi:MAG: hypothetical protein M3Q39_13915 [Actinomycetota bacterium]|nr:hypothetical protein [Actinomycetota bacterium]